MTKNDQKNIETGLEIAIIGMSGKFPGAGSLDQFWENLKNGTETISFFSTEELKECGIDDQLLNNPDYVKAYGLLSGKENFDASFFGFSPKEAESIDPQIRLFLECSWETLEDAGYDPTTYKGAIGLYGGIADGFSWRAARMLKELRTGTEQTIHLLDTSLLLSTRVSHKLDLKGPSITLYTACSTSLVAVHQACRALLTGECDMALAGAVSAQPIDKTGYLYQEGMILSPDGHNRSFDAQAKGTIFGEGIGIVLLKRLKEALAAGDNIKSVIKASAVNNDGTGKSSFTAPGKKRIADVIRTALKLSRLTPENLSYVETHGTATDLGDAIEIEALKEAFNSNKKAYCAIGSVKSNIGHLDVAAGMAGLIKTVQAIQQRQIPASLYFTTPNPKIDLIDSPFYINTALTSWEREGEIKNTLRAGVCSFGIGGTNVFILLEQPPVHTEPANTVASPPVPHLLLLSARTDSALETMTQNLAHYLRENPGLNLEDLAYTLQIGRKNFSRRRMFICANKSEAIAALTKGPGPFSPGTPGDELLKQIGDDWLAGGTVDWPSFYAQHPEYDLPKRRRISLPTYPFERQRYWIDNMVGDPLSTFSSISQKKGQADDSFSSLQKKEPLGAGLPPTKIEKSNENEALGLYQRPHLSTVYQPPSNEIEQALTGIWQRFFGIREVGILDDFFELGGDSLKVITVVTEIHKQMDARVPIPQIFDTPTIKGLASYLKSRSAESDKYSAIEPVEEKEYYPLSSVQMRIYVLQQLEIDSTGYNTPLLFTLGGQVDRQRMESVFKSLVARHESLRTSFELIEGEVVQRVRTQVDFAIEYYETYTSCEAIIKSFIRPFDVSCAPLLRVGLAETGNDSYLFMVDMHHSITDGSSIGLLIREFATFYGGESLPELRIQYKDYTHWQSSDKQREAVKTQEAYWLETFAGELPILNLPLDYARPALQSFEGQRTPFKINSEEAAALRSLALNEDVTLFMVLLSLYYILLAKLCNQEDIVIGTPIAGRNHADLQHMIGMLVNTLALRNAPVAEKTSREFLKEVKKNILAAFQNQDYLFEDLVEQITRQMNRDVSRNPVFDTIFNLLNFESMYEKNFKITSPGLTLKPYEYERGIAIFDLSLEAVDTGKEITFNFEFCTRLFNPETIDRFIGYFKNIVKTVAAAADQKIAQIEILTDQEKQQILYHCSGPQEEFKGELLIHDLFERQVEKTPDHIAGIEIHELNELSELHEFHEITYRELHKQSDKLAGGLIEKGVIVGDIIGIMLPRSVEMVTAILAILKAGGAYLPIDPDYPHDRIDYMLKDTKAKILLTTNEMASLSITDNPHHSAFDIPRIQYSKLSYIIYTSGSTGRPKGVMIAHRNVRNLLLFQYHYTSIDFSRVLQFTTISFDVSFQEIFSTLLAGGMLLLVDKGIIRDFPRLFRVIEQNILKTLFLPASFLKFIFNLEEYAALFPSCVKHIVTAGEQPIVTDYFRTYLKTNNVHLHNHYGPSETHVVTALTMDPAVEIPALPSIGKPLANTQIYIVDKELHLLPLGIAGELLIGGDQVGCGYLNNPELTWEKFKINKFNRSYKSNKTYIFYKTGDLARWLPNGNIEFLGRIDLQVKIRGYRIELEEIESCLMAVDYVKEAVVIAGTDPKGEAYLCAYIVPVVPGQANKKTATELRNTLSGVLPEYMVPSYFIYLDKIPLTPSGKVNRKALPEPVIENGVSLDSEKYFSDADADLTPVEKKDYYPLSSAQKRLYIIQKLAPGSTACNMPSAVVIEERIDKQKLEKAFRQLILRHESFRTSFVTLDDQPAQRVQQDFAFEIEYFDLATDVTSEYGETQTFCETIIKSFIRPFELTYAPLLRVSLSKLEEAKYLMIVDMHHIISDGVSMRILMRDFILFYQGDTPAELPIQYKDFTCWQQSGFVKQKVAVQESYWVKRFSGGISELTLPIDYPRPVVQSFEGGNYKFEVREEETAALNRMAQQHEATLFMVLLAIMNILLGKLGSREDIIIGTPTAGRRHKGLEQLIGVFVNILALRNFPAGELSFIDFLTEVRTRTLEDFENQDCHFEDLVEKVAVRWGSGRNPLFDVMFVLHDIKGLKTGEVPGQLGMKAFEYDFEKKVSRFDMTWNTIEKNNQLLFNIEYSAQLFKEETIVKFSDCFKQIMASIIAFPDVNISQIDIMQEGERRRILEEFNAVWTEYPRHKTISQLFEDQVEQTPDRLALVGADEGEKKKRRREEEKNDGIEALRAASLQIQLSYRQLNEQSIRVASVLQEKGIKSGHIVGIMGERSSAAIIGVLGILKSGGAYLPIDPEYPQERIDYMLKDSGAKLLAIANGLEGEKVRRWEGEKERPSRGLQHSAFDIPRIQHSNPLQLAYIIYTSGSTGKPKGVMVTQHNVVRLVKNTNYISFKVGDRLLQTGALEFDASTFEIWGVLLNGLTLYLAKKEEILTADRLKAMIRGCDIGIMWMTSPLFDQMIEVDIEIFSGLSYFLVGGDVLSPIHIERLRNHYPRLNVINCYGPTENTTFSTTMSVDREYTSSIPIGRPIANSSVFILDKYGLLCPLGVVGELYLGGDGLARGYLNNPELTAERFNRAYKTYRTYILYKTGDLARWLPDGCVEFLGRIDFQVKIRGYRIEPGEIKRELLRHPCIREAVVAVKETSNSEKFLCAYIVHKDPHLPGPTQAAETAEFRDFLLQVLPDYMVPAHFIPVTKIPLTANGKVDIKALPEPGMINKYETAEVIKDEIEECVLETWFRVLDVEKSKIGRHTDFFKLGGHSLKAVAVIARIYKELDVEVPLVEIFKTPTAAGLAEYIKKNLNSGIKYTSIDPAEKKEYYVLSPAQKRMYLLNQMDPESTVYNITQFFNLEMEFSQDKLTQIFRHLVQRHESFRTSFATINEEPVQRIHEDLQFEIAYDDGLRTGISALIRPFNLSCAPLLRVVFSKLAKQGYVMMVDMHHIVSDGVSMDILVREFWELYKGEVLPGLRLQYKDYVQWQNSDVVKRKTRLQGKYWLREFRDIPPKLELPIDFMRPEVQSFAGSLYYFELGREENAVLNRLAQEQGATLYIVLLTLFNIFLFKLSGREDIIIGTAAAGRGHADLEAVIGMFVNTLALRNFPGNGKTIIEFLQEVKANTLPAFENQDFPFEDLVEKVVLKREPGRNPLFDVMFSLQNVGNLTNTWKEKGTTDSILNVEKNVSHFDMTWMITENENGLVFAVEYCTRLFKEQTIQRFGAYFKKIVSEFMTEPTVHIGDIVIILDEERQLLLYEFNNLDSIPHWAKAVPELFVEQVERTPDHIALVTKKAASELHDLNEWHEITYRELNEKSNDLAHILREKGIQADNIVALNIDRCIEMVIGVLGILKAGGAYLPIDPDYPRERIDYMMKDSGAKLLAIANGANGANELEGEKVRRCEGEKVLLESIIRPSNHLPYHHSSFDIPLVSHIHHSKPHSNLAYIIYTSGTTGKPKGILVEHRNLTAYVCAFLQEFKPGPDDIAILEASFVFDAFVEEVYPILLVGGRLCIAQKQEVMDAHLLEAFILRNNITIISCSPMLLNQINQFSNLKNLPVHTFISGADVLNKEYTENLLGIHKIYNVYGPTETTVCALHYQLPENITSTVSNIPIGKAFTGYQVYILAEYQQLQLIGAPGEICITGSGVTRGYLNNPELTAEKFKINWPFRSNKAYILYKTGDLGRWVPDPAVPGSYVCEFLGRIDHQVKIRGFRIELGEIEYQLLQQGSVKEVVVVDREDENKDKYLCAYIIPVTGTTWNPAILKEFLSTRLPAYMIPAYFVCLNGFPLTAGGKLDRGALPLPTVAPDSVPIQEETVEIRTLCESESIETKLIVLWSEVLGIDRMAIGSETNFFEIGGHSLKATVLSGKIHKTLGVRVPLAEIFRKPTVKGLAGYIKGAKEEAFFAVEPVEKQEYYPLSSAQKRLYVLQQMDLGSSVYNMPSAVIVVGEIDKQILANTFYGLIQRHESFRTSFVTVNDEPVQKIHENVEFEIEYDDSDTNEHGQTSFIIHHFIRAFDLAKAPLLRVGLSKLEESKYLLMVDIHHIINDGISTRILLREFGEYRGKTLPKLRLQYKDYAAWQNSKAGKMKVKDQEKYWLKEFSDDVAVLTLPTDFPRPAVQSFVGSNSHFELGQEETRALNRLALKQGATLFMVLISIFNIMLAKLSGQEDIVIGVPVAGRKHADLQHIIGIFVNTLALRNFPAGNKTFKGFLQEVRTRTLKAFENEDCQFEELVDRLALKREADRNPLFDVMFALLNKSEQKLEKGSAETTLKVYECEFENTVSRFDMSWNIIEFNNRLDFAIEYSTKLFKRETIERFTIYFKKILAAIITEPVVKIAGIEIMPEEERQRILCEFNNTTAEYPSDKTIQELFADQVQLTPNHIAAVGDAFGIAGTAGLTNEITGPASMTYKQLMERSDCLANILVKKGALPGDIIGIMIKRSLDMIIGLLGILKAGCAYLPIDPDYPNERIDYMLKDSMAKILLTANEMASLSRIDNSHHSSFAIPRIHHSKQHAYIIYTSGTTGRPKGVMAEHRGVVRLVKNTNYFIFNQKDRILPTGALEFDISTFETWGPLLNGLSMYLVAKETLLNTSTLGNLLIKYDIAILHLIPQLFNRSVDQDPSIFQGLDYLLIGGDRVNRESIEIVRKRCPSVNILHMYGPTENTTFSSFLPVDREYDTNLPIGRPISNSTAYILDKNELPVPFGVIGELWLGGDGVARGYLNNPELTAEKFNQDLWDNKDDQDEGGALRANFHHSSFIIHHSKLYRTGDLARWLPEGVIEFIGRGDHQVKVRGIRVELGEIENCLLKHEGVKDVVVLDRKDEKGEIYLCAYIVPASETVVDAELREYLTLVLPRNMVPAYFIFLEKIPLTTVGKIDRRSLPEPKFQVNEKYMGPLDKLEECLIELWSYVLSLEKEKIARNANFFALGGHSLKATVLLARIHKELDVKIPLAELFKTPTIEGLAGYIRGAKEEAFFAVEAVEEREYYPLSSAQRRLYVLQQMDLESVVYNMPFIVKLDTMLTMDRLEKMVGHLVQRHESFRTSFQNVNEEPVQRIHKEVDFTIKYHELAAIDQKAGISAYIRKFDLSRAPLLRVEFIKLAENECIFIADMHHIISDGFSMDILLREFPSIYEGEQLPPLRIQYKDYTYWQTSKTVREKIKDQEEFWLKEFQDDIPILDLPFDYPRPQVQSFEGSFLNFALSREETNSLKKAALEEGVTLYLLLVTIFDILLYKLSGQEDIVIGTPIAGRRHADLQLIIGMFVNTLVLRNFPSGQKTFAEFLAEVKTRTLRAFENQDYQFEDLVEKVSVGRDPSRNPLFDVMFTWQELVNKKEDSGSHLYEGHVSRFDMTWFASERDNCIALGIEYCTKLFKPETIKRFSDYFKKIVSYIIAAPDAGIGEIDILSDEEKQQLLYDFNGHDKEYPGDKTIPQLFQGQVEKTPDHIAIFSHGRHLRTRTNRNNNKEEEKKRRREEEKESCVETLRAASLQYQYQTTYYELNEQSGKLAGLLIEKDVQPDDIVGIIIERSAEMIIGILGILKSGAAYLPFNPSQPEARTNFMIKDSGAKLLTIINGANELEGEKLRSWEGEKGRPSPGLHHSNSNQLAYIIYTSGSTGKPKGVPITHANLSPLLHWGYLNLGINENDRAIQNLSYYFDWSVWEIFITLTTGASLFMITEELLLSPEKSVAFIQQHAITVLHVTPTQYRYYLAAGQKLETLRYLFIGAEAMGFDLAKRSFESVNDNCRVFNMYGPTEATIIASVLEIRRSNLEKYKRLSSVPIGRAVGNTDLLILDKQNNLCPINVTGELYISGGGLSQGYLNNPELTAEKFNRSYRSYRTYILYKTGDLARWLPDGCVEFLGRSDFQVKIRGYRIELEEIEKRLAEHPNVREAVVLALDLTPTAKNSGEKYLCAYIVPGSQDMVNSTELKEFLSRSLPDYMVPSYFVNIDHIPLNPNGKVDRKALPTPSIEIGTAYETPHNEIERKLVDIWAETLALDKTAIGIHDDFFERGGHSLKAAILVSRMQKEFGLAVPLVEVFKTPTVKGLGEYIGSNVNFGENKILLSPDENLVLLRKNDPHTTDAVNLFLIHAGSGEVEGYIELCGRLNSRYNCWGLRVDRVDRTSHFIPLDLSIPELAAKYIKTIKKVQPNGPYFILGWCIGGTIAFEMSRQLEQNGEKPGTLCLVNAYAPFKHKGKINTFNVASELNFLSFFKSIPGGQQLKKELKNAVDIPQIWQHVVNYYEERKIAVEILKKAIPKNIADPIPVPQSIPTSDQTNMDLREFIYYVNIIRSLGLAREIYSPMKKGVKISKSNADTYFFGASRSMITNKNQWPAYFTNPVKFYEVEGDHFTIFKMPDVIAFAELFNRLF